MTTAFDVARFIEKAIPGCDMTKLQKLLYYSQAWSLVWDGKPLFSDAIEAWKLGPVVGDVWRESAPKRGNPAALSEESVATVRAVVETYGKMSGGWLVELTHRERPWVDARNGIPADQNSSAVISDAQLVAWYSKVGLASKRFPEEYIRGLEFLVETPEDEVHLILGDQEFVPAEPYVRWLETGETVGESR